MLSKEMKTAEKNNNSMNTTINNEKELVLVKKAKEQNTSFNPDYQLCNDDCNLNYWGAGFMGKDLLF